MSQPNPPPQLEYPYASRPNKQSFVEPIQYPAIAWQLGPTWLPLLGLTVVCLAANVAVVPLMEVFNKRDLGAVFVYGCGGIMAGEAFILSTWLAWGGGSFLKRLVLHWAAAIVLSVAWLVGAVCCEGTSNGDVRDMLEVVPFSAPLFGLAIQLPLWIARQYFGWRLVDACADHERTRPLAIRDLMLGTVMVAVSLACARLAEGMDRNSEGWLIWAILAPSVAGISLVSVLPVAAWMLHARNLTTGFICLPIQTAIAIVVTLPIAAHFERPDLWEMVGIGIIVVSFAMTLTAAALAARAAGFRLDIGNGRRPEITSFPNEGPLRPSDKASTT